MTDWVVACGADDVDEEDVIRFDHAGRTFAIYRSPDDEYFATDGLCTHEKVHLSGGLVMDDIIECPKHNGRFNYKTGAGQGRAGLRQPADLSGQGRGGEGDDRDLGWMQPRRSTPHRPFGPLLPRGERNAWTARAYPAGISSPLWGEVARRAGEGCYSEQTTRGISQ